MGNNKKTTDKSRRDFFSMFITSEKKAAPPEMVKMLTPDGKLVEVEKSVFEAATKKQKATKKDIFNWMQNPSKENS
ncbi:MAG: hypothetical protein WBC06_02930 [Chitinophagaceae bacterium]